MPINVFTCDRCGQTIMHNGGCGTGYARYPDSSRADIAPDNRDLVICYQCCGELDKAWMTEKGKITLYLSQVADTLTPRLWKITNWPNTLSFPAYVTVGRHNIAGKRYDVYFTGPDGYKWHGVTYGNQTQLCHCKRTKQKA